MTPDDSARAADVDELLTALTDRHCRATVIYFRDTSEEVLTLDELADGLVDQFSEDSDEVAIQLHHMTLPRLEDVGLLEYDPRSHTVRYRGHPELESMIENLLG